MELEFNGVKVGLLALEVETKHSIDQYTCMRKEQYATVVMDSESHNKLKLLDNCGNPVKANLVLRSSREEFEMDLGELYVDGDYYYTDASATCVELRFICISER